MNILLLILYGAIAFSAMPEEDKLALTTALTIGGVYFDLETIGLFTLFRFLQFEPTYKRFQKSVLRETGITSVLGDLGLSRGKAGRSLYNRNGGQFYGGYGPPYNYYPYPYLR